MDMEWNGQERETERERSILYDWLSWAGQSGIFKEDGHYCLNNIHFPSCVITFQVTLWSHKLKVYMEGVTTSNYLRLYKEAQKRESFVNYDQGWMVLYIRKGKGD